MTGFCLFADFIHISITTKRMRIDKCEQSLNQFDSMAYTRIGRLCHIGLGFLMFSLIIIQLGQKGSRQSCVTL